MWQDLNNIGLSDTRDTRDLNNLVARINGGYLSDASQINDLGQIAGRVSLSGGIGHARLLTPR